MHKEGRTFLVGHGTSLLPEEIKIEPPRQVTTTCYIWRYLLTDNVRTHANELSKRLCCFYTVIISVFKCLGGVWKLWAKGNSVE